MIRVLIADDHALVRRGLGDLLGGADGVEVVGAIADGSLAADAVTALEPDIVLMDLSMPGLDGIEATRAVLATRPATKVIILTSFSENAKILAALDVGAVGYLLKDAEPEEIVQGIRAAVAGGSPLDPRAATALVEQRQQAQATEVTLTPREIEVLQCLGDGLANKAIARRLGIAEKTVKAHLTRVFSAIGVSDRTQAVLWARDHGVVPTP